MQSSFDVVIELHCFKMQLNCYEIHISCITLLPISIKYYFQNIQNLGTIFVQFKTTLLRTLTGEDTGIGTTFSLHLPLKCSDFCIHFKCCRT